MIRQFVNVMAENYKTGVYSLHRLDVSKHLFHQSRADARTVPFLAEAQGNIVDEQPMLELDRFRLQELPSAVATWSSPNVDHFSLLATSHCKEGGILCLSKAGTAVLYDPDSSCNFIMPGLNGFKGPPVPVSLSLAAVGDQEEEQLYIMHGGPDGLELNSNNYHFNVLRYGPRPYWCNIKCWYWQSLPAPPFVDDDPQYKYKPAFISSYTVVGSGHTICLSSVQEDIGTYYFNTVDCEWKYAGDWVLPFTGKAEYISDLKLWLGFSLRSPGYLCAAASDLSDMPMVHKPMSSLVAWPDHTPKEWMAVNVKLLSLGSGKFAVAKVFRVSNTSEEPAGLFSERDTVKDEIVVLSGMELEFGGKDNSNNLQGLKLLQHKSISYTCAKNTAIHSVL